MRVMTYRAPKAVEILELDKKNLTEVIGYRFNLLSIQAFSAYGETFVNASSVIWKIYDSAALTTEVSSMLYGQEANVDESWIQANIQGGSHSHLYFLKGTLTTVSGRVYVVLGSIYVVNPLLAIIPVVVAGGGGTSSTDAGTKSGVIIFSGDPVSITDTVSSDLIGCSLSIVSQNTIRIIWDTEYATYLYTFYASGMSSSGAKIDIIPGIPGDTTRTAAFIEIEIPQGTTLFEFIARGVNAE